MRSAGGETGWKRSSLTAEYISTLFVAFGSGSIQILLILVSLCKCYYYSLACRDAIITL